MVSSPQNTDEILPGVREFPIYDFGGAKSYANVRDQKQVHNLAQQIQVSNEINPVIIVEENNGPYVLEGGHRISALVELNAKLIPAIIVIDVESFNIT